MLESASTTFPGGFLLIFWYCILVLLLFEVDSDLSPCSIFSFAGGLVRRLWWTCFGWSMIRLSSTEWGRLLFNTRVHGGLNNSSPWTFV
uniref:Uncharacterized protein n=1 Tax=Physcomitrium patens TaxID=3218 RepID=A0A2K1L341_PHYPA|nr:hypothetical protein PHYPA_003240 [Physcomitrium patens]